MEHFKPYRHLDKGAIVRAWSAAKADHRAEPDAAPAMRLPHWRAQKNTWVEQPRSEGRDNRKRNQPRRTARQTRERSRNISIFQ